MAHGFLNYWCGQWFLRCHRELPLEGQSQRRHPAHRNPARSGICQALPPARPAARAESHPLLRLQSPRRQSQTRTPCARHRLPAARGTGRKTRRARPALSLLRPADGPPAAGPAPMATDTRGAVCRTNTLRETTASPAARTVTRLKTRIVPDKPANCFRSGESGQAPPCSGAGELGKTADRKMVPPPEAARPSGPRSISEPKKENGHCFPSSFWQDDGTPSGWRQRG